MSSSWNQIKEPKDMEEILNDTITAQELEVFIEFRNFLHLFLLIFARKWKFNYVRNESSRSYNRFSISSYELFLGDWE